METLDLRSRGDVSENIDWGTKEHIFENGARQYQQKYTEPDMSWTMTFTGVYADWLKLEQFFNDRKGQIEKFKMMINGKEEIVRFAEPKLSPKIKRHLQEPVAFECEVAVRRVKED